MNPPDASCSSGTWLSPSDACAVLRDARATVLDCRSGGRGIKGACRVRLPTVLMRRLGAGTLPSSSISSALSPDRDVLIIADSIALGSLAYQVHRLLIQRGFRISLYIGDTDKLVYDSSELIEERSEAGNADVSSLNLDRLHIEEGRVGSARATMKGADLFPVQILPYLYLGNAETAKNRDVLDRYNIRYIINVTRNLENSFESDGHFHYLQIAVDDTCSHNLAEHFPEAISFVEQAACSGSAALVHCVAGISRSVTVCLAYLMYSRCCSLDDAFDLVHKRSALIAPNFHFMGQLSEFERQLAASRVLHHPNLNSTSSSPSASPVSDT